jgi:hypothetical protein
MTDHEQEQEMEIEALRAICMDDMQEIPSGESGLGTSARCFQITVSPMEDDEEEPTDIPVRLALIFAHTPTYPDEPPLIKVRSLQGVKMADVKELQEKLEQEATENLGMSMMFTLATSSKEWLREKYGQEACGTDEGDEDAVAKEEVIEPHGEAVTVDSFLAWRERFEAEMALEQAKLMPESALVASREKRLTGRQWFEMKAGKMIPEDVDEEDEDEDKDLDFDEDFDDDEDIDEDDMLEYLQNKNDKKPIPS